MGVLLSFMLWLFGIYFVQAVTDYVSSDYGAMTEDDFDWYVTKFGSVQTAALSLFKTTSGGEDWGDYMERMRDIGMTPALMFLFYILFFLLSVMNIVTSIFVDKAMKLA